MKHLKIITVVFMSMLVLSCSGDDDSGGGGDSDPVVQFSATINGSGYTNYLATLGSVTADGDVGLTIVLTDSNNNIVRIFMNNTGGFNSGVVKKIGNVDGDGFGTNALFRDQGTQITYNSSVGSITIFENVQSNIDPSNRLVTGNFDIIANVNTGETITIIGTFENIPVFGL